MYVDLFLYHWNEMELVIMNELFDVLLNSVCQYFVENLCPAYFYDVIAYNPTHIYIYELPIQVLVQLHFLVNIFRGHHTF
jgi:hypothetical protein